MQNEEIVYMCANVVAARKEKAIMEAFDHLYGKGKWTESDIAEIELEFIIDIGAQTETLIVGGIPMVEFGRMDFDVLVETGMVQCLYAQTIKPLYSCCGVGE